jgi:hypothetical protein
MTFAFINIHLDIYIGSLSSYHTEKADASAIRKKLRRKRKFSCFVVYEKKGRCFFAFGSKVKFRPHQSRSYTDKGEKIYYKVYINLHKFFYNYITKISPEFFAEKSFAATVKLQPVILQLHHPVHIKTE